MGDDLGSIRAELRRRGYLQRGVERFLLQDALRPRAAGAAVMRLALRVGLLLGILAAIVGGVALALINGGGRAHPADAAVLALHLLLPSFLGTVAGFLLVAAPFALAFRASRRAGERLALALAIAASAAWLGFVAIRGRLLVSEMSLGWAAALALGAAVVAWMLGRVLYDGLLALAARFSRLEPAGFALPRWVLGAVAIGGGASLLAPLLLASTGDGRAPAAFLPTAPGERVLLVGVDGVLPEEVDYLLARGDLAAVSRRLVDGGAVLSYIRPGGPPPSFWTTVATGLEPAAHGVESLDSYRPAGVSVPLVRSGPLRGWWHAESLLGLCEYKPVLAARRRGWTVWELAARGGSPIAAIDWWSTFPAEPLPGLVVSHGGYQLLAENAPGVVHAAADAAAMAALRASDSVKSLDATLVSALPAGAAERVLERAVRPDLFYLAALRSALARSPKAAALYLPGIDLAADGWQGSDVAFADLVRSVLVEVDGVVAAGADFATVVIVADPGRRGGGEGRVLLLRSGCAARGAILPAAVASTLLRALGLPQSSELPPPVDGCGLPAAASNVATYGPRRVSDASAAAGDEYLQNLEALGYL